MSGFSFSFSGEDIEDNSISDPDPDVSQHSKYAVETGTLRRPPTSAFPIAGQAQLPPHSHILEEMLQSLPSKIAYSTLIVKLDDGTQLSIPRRELWDVRVQLMAEDDDEGLTNLGKDDVRTGVYEGGFKSWESSVDVVKVLHGRREEVLQYPGRFLELGCGTALPSLAVFQWLLEQSKERPAGGLEIGLADYNPTVLQLVTLPNLLLSWAQVKRKDSWEAEGEVEIDADLLEKFFSSLKSHDIRLLFLSGAWSPEFVRLAIQTMRSDPARLTILGAETIYSPVALRSFAETLMSLLDKTPAGDKIAFIAAKKVYFGVGGSIEDFCDSVRAKGAVVKQIREESDGVRRAVVEIKSK
ncbi:S-adenosylmethionine-dependent methyltransferase [Hyphodiscus hymeniophilus]|uniref:protein-histidine N-methyltransferase n=1 Tax=Hyphodiscus hymeniophilus TaxID=353542 RepID=A0A9P6VH33_9HELO|nr:S-adenosylmethionine-dependent methyltransferase [Hyphodiscus hymeniophilus]